MGREHTHREIGKLLLQNTDGSDDKVETKLLELRTRRDNELVQLLLTELASLTGAFSPQSSKRLSSSDIWSPPYLRLSDIKNVIKDTKYAIADVYDLDVYAQDSIHVDEADGSLRVYYASPLQHMLYELDQAQTKGLALIDKILLRYPYGPNGIKAEEFLLTSLAQCLSKPWVAITNRAYKHNRIDMKNGTIQTIDGTVLVRLGDLKRKERIKQVSGMFFKEHPDFFGADGTVIDLTNLTVHRVRLKLGNGALTAECPQGDGGANSDGICKCLEKLHEGRKAIEQFVKDHLKVDPATLKWKNYLMTTHTIDERNRESAMKWLKQKKISNCFILAREEMFDIWTEDIKEFDRSMKLGIYAKLE